jgi:hypothetical protein
MSRISQGDRLYMGLEGHTEAESKEAMDPANINTSKIVTQHRHDIKATIPYPNNDPPLHDADFRHYQWQVHTVAPLYFEVRITPYYTHIEFIQPIPGPTKILQSAQGNPKFKYAIDKDALYILYPYSVAPLPPYPDITGTYQTIFDECLKMYYLYCSSITRVEAMEKIYSRYGIYSK